jgi:hypothetical protein
MDNISYLWNWIVGISYLMIKGNQNSSSNFLCSGVQNKLEMKEIKLSRGLVSLVDDEDYIYLNQFKWYAVKAPNTFYAKRSLHMMGNNKKSVTIAMQNIIKQPTKGCIIDHIDRNGLNNQKSNLRECTQQLNCYNSSPHTNLNIIGVTTIMQKRGTVYRVQISINRKLKHIGIFKSINDAKCAYNNAVVKYHGEFVNLNII